MTRDEMVEIKRHFESATAETRRHFDGVAEGLSAQIRQVAEGQGLLAEELRAVKEDVHELRAETRHEFTELRAIMSLSYAAFERRLTRLEGALADVAGRPERLEKRTHA
jgi:hypothetical protein